MSETNILKMKRLVPGGRVRQKNEPVIISAAEQEFLDFGFKGASMKRIAERAELPRANIHYYFKNKLDLYGAVLSDIVELWNNSFDLINEDDDPYTAMSAYIRAKVMFSKTNPTASRIFASEIIHGAPYLMEYLQTDFREWVKLKTQVIQSWIDKGKMAAIEPIHLLFLIWGATQHYADFGVQVRAAMDKEDLSDEDFEHIADSMTQIILRGCGISPQ
ncbi:TetR family transcriptional regulator [Hahella sp. CCB-MM4]|uniref:TetR/AcrR family transcriptional regulator n=1 Tax=Hahella sp. (strain CCB-MM4) TaxID=1926491 RepID=UPI000B9A6C44|nr:TetR/AcrR family transcriptional regulator [Hahella sp. CCB-MM4]OZG73946.1 TetR family transcriptional regulator [Hahella sp. CCB-MM4]